MSKYNLNLILAVNEDYAIGLDNDLLYFFPTDLKRFVSLTKEKTVVMGRNTWESLPTKLPKRKNVVLTSSGVIQPSIKKDKEVIPDLIITSIEDVLELSKNEEIWVIGGASLYMSLIKYAERVELTKIFDSSVKYDTDVKDIEKELINFNIINNEEIHEVDRICGREICINFLTYSK